MLEGGEAEAEGCRRSGNKNIIWDDWASARNLDSGEGTSVVKGREHQAAHLRGGQRERASRSMPLEAGPTQSEWLGNGIECCGQGCFIMTKLGGKRPGKNSKIT